MVWQRIITGGTWALLFFAPLAIGTVDLWSWTAVAGTGVLLLTIWFLGTPPARPALLTAPGAVWLLVLLYTALQLVPLPAVALRLISPKAWEIRDFVATGGLSSWDLAPISLDPPATVAELAKVIGLWALFVVAVNFTAADDRRLRRVLTALVWSGVVITAVGFVDAICFAGRLLGTYRVIDRFFVATFVNPNHLAGFLGLAAIVSLGLALTAKERAEQASFAVLTVFVASGLFLSLSRGGILVFLTSLVFLGVLLLARGRRRPRSLWWVPVVTVTVLGISSYLAKDKISEQFASVDSTEALVRQSKVEIWQEQSPLLWDFALTGVGRGAFPMVHRHYKTATGAVTFTHLENEALQAVADWGCVGLLAWLSILATVALGIYRGVARGTLLAAMAGLFSVGLHNMVDFNLATGGVAVPFVMLLGMVAARTYPEVPGISWSQLCTPVPHRWFGWGIAVAWVLVGGGMHWASEHSLAGETAAVMSRTWTRAGNMQQEIEPVMQRHPADYFLPLQLANAYLAPARTSQPLATRVHDREAALVWAGRALYLNPTSGDAHLLVARILAEKGVMDQALMEYGRAWILGQQRAVAEDLVSDPDKLAAWRRVLPSDPEERLRWVELLVSHRRTFEAQIIAEELIAADPPPTRALQLLADIARSNQDPDHAADLATEALSLDPTLAWAYRLRAALLLPSDQAAAAAILREGMQAQPADMWLVLDAAGHAIQQGDLVTAEQLAQRLTEQGHAVQAHALLGNIEERRGRYPLAVQHLRAAASLAPTDVSYRLATARILEKMGIRSEAVAEYSAALRLGYSEVWVREQIRRLLEGDHESK